MTEAVRGPELCKAVGITYRQLDYWAHTGLLRPSVSEANGRGSVRRYSADDVARARIIKRLLDAGISLQSVRAALALLHDAIDDKLRFLVMGGGCSVACAEAELERVVSETGGVALVLDLEVAA